MEKTMKKIMGERLKLVRLCANKSAEDIANLTGKSVKSIWAWEEGRSQPDADILVKLKNYYGLPSIAQFYGEDETIDDLKTLEVKKLFGNLNQDGQKKVISYAKDLINSRMYEIKDTTDCVNDSSKGKITSEELMKRIKFGEQIFINGTPKD